MKITWKWALKCRNWYYLTQLIATDGESIKILYLWSPLILEIIVKLFSSFCCLVDVIERKVEDFVEIQVNKKRCENFHEHLNFSNNGLFYIITESRTFVFFTDYQLSSLSALTVAYYVKKLRDEIGKIVIRNSIHL